MARENSFERSQVSSLGCSYREQGSVGIFDFFSRSFIRLFKGEECVRMFTGHTDVVRGIILMRAPSDCQSVDFAKEPSLEPSEPLFLTCSNDATLQLHSLSNSRIERPDRVPENGGLPIRTLKGSESLVYESCWMGEDLNVGSCGEDGCLRIWDCDSESSNTSPSLRKVPSPRFSFQISLLKAFLLFFLCLFQWSFS